jgi:uncharacterized protein YjeT (DUF2065 family)
MLDLSFLALSMGCWVIIRMLPGILAPQRMGALFSELIVTECNTMYSYVQAAAHVLYGIAVLYAAHHTEAEYEIVMTILGWISALSGVVILYFPKSIKNLSKNMRKTPANMKRIFSVFYVAAAGALVYLGIAVY